MKLLMYVKNDLIDSVTLEREKITIPGYTRKFIRMLKEKHEWIIRQSVDEPEFILHNATAHPNTINIC